MDLKSPERDGASATISSGVMVLPEAYGRILVLRY